MAHPALQIDSLTFRYPGASEAVVDVRSLALEPGEQILLAGGSGRGKSTLLQIIAGLLEPSSGTVRVDGTDVHSLRAARRDLFRGRKIGMIFQTFNLLHGFSALENVMAALMFSDVPRAEHRARATEVLRSLGIERIHAEPDALSIGQQQRVAVARAIVTNPVLVMADEPTASLDPENAATAMELIQTVCRERGTALLCTSHDPAIASRFSRRETMDGLAAATRAADTVEA